MLLLELGDPEELPIFGQGWLDEEEPPGPGFGLVAGFEEGVVWDPLDVPDELDDVPDDAEVDAVVDAVVEGLLVAAPASAELSPKLRPKAPAAIPAARSGFLM